jgi:hypothetical protein
VIVKLDANFNEDSRDIRLLLSKLTDIQHLSSNRNWQIRARKCRYLGPWAAAVLHATYLRGQLLAQSPKIQLPTEPPQLVRYCEFAGMSQAYNRGAAPTPEHPDCETIPLEQFHHASWDRSDRIIRLLRRHAEIDADLEDQVRSCVQEIVQNTIDHAQSAIGGVMSAKFFNSSQDVRVGIVDMGIGISESLRRAYPDADIGPVNALQRVTKGGFTSRSRPNNMGQGISNLFSLVPSAGGRIAVFSRSASAESHAPGETSISPEAFDFPGTAVLFTLPIRVAST